ncbi:hypothetical protein DMENIID0001_057340 [Sergentomyia squamirostris]
MPPKKSKVSVKSAKKATTILKLNDVCLFTIFSYLSLIDVIDVEKVCKKFKKVANTVYKNYKTLNFDHIFDEGINYNKRSIQEMCMKVGPYITSLTISQSENHNFDDIDDDYDDMDESDSSNDIDYNYSRFPFVIRILKYCKKLEYLHLSGFNLEKEIRDLIPIFRKLKTAKLENANLNDNIKKCFKVSQNLEILSLAGNDKLYGECLLPLKNIKQLNLHKCSKIHSDDFLKFCKENPDLTHLDISYCDKLNQKCFEAMVKTFKGLKYLTLGFAYEEHKLDYTILAKLTKLTHLTLSCNRKFGPLFQIMADKKKKLEYLNASCTSKETLEAIALLNNLKVFVTNKNFNVEILLQFRSSEKLVELHISCMNLSDNDMIRVINSFPALKYLNIEGSQSITKDFVTKHLSDLLPRKKPLEINVANTKISRNLLEELNNAVPSTSGGSKRSKVAGTLKSKRARFENTDFVMYSKIKFLFKHK